MDCVTLVYSRPFVGRESLRLERGLPRDHCRTHSGWETYSPLYPVLTGELGLPDATEFSIAFVIARNPYRAIGSLELEDQRRLFFGLGLASIVGIGSDHDQIQQLAHRLESHAVAFEIWRVGPAAVTKEQPRFTVAPSQHTTVDLHPSQAADPDIQAMLCELQLNLNRLGRYAEVFVPDLQPFVTGVCDYIHEILGEVSYLERLGTEPPPPRPASISLPIDRALRNLPLYCQQKLNSNHDVLVQVNSSLAYVISQLFNGCLPGLGDSSLVSHHSFLGIGTAWRAPLKLHQFLVNAFSTYDVSSLISRHFTEYSWIPVASANSLSSQPLRGRTVSDGDDPPHPKIVYFSARHGFGESEAALTAASQVLNYADSVRWTLMTLTHEALHTHVKSLVAAVFAARDEAGESLPAEHAFEQRVHEYFASKSLEQEGKLRRIHTVSFGLLRFAWRFAQFGGQARCQRLSTDLPTTLKWTNREPSSVGEFKEAFRRSYHFASEIMVHSLDFHYFYGGNVELYVDSVWESWATVPAVTEKLDWYLLRTLVAIATNSTKEVLVRFSEAKNLLIDRLSAIRDKRPELKVLTVGIELLQDERISRWLSLMFMPAIELADITTKLLLHHDLRLALSEGDRLITEVDGQSVYDLDDFVFEDAAIGNPIAFCRDRLRRALGEDRGRDDYESVAATAWVFLTCAAWEGHPAP